MKKEIFVRKIEQIKIIEDTEDVKFLINDKINLYVNLDSGITLTLLEKIKTPFIIAIGEDEYSTDKTIPSSTNIEIVINRTDFNEEDFTRTPSIILKGKRKEDVIRKVIKQGFALHIEATIVELDTDYNEIGLKELIEFSLKNRQYN